MLFGIDEDRGDRIEGWLMPDNPSDQSRVIVRLDDDRRSVVDAIVYRPLLKEQGLHNTGVCGFVIDELNCPGLESAAFLEIYDSEQNVRLYRRMPAALVVPHKFFRLETQLFGARAVDAAIEPFFHQAYPRIELLSEETIRAAVALPFTPSIYVVGRVFWRAWAPLLRDRGYLAGVMLRDPFHELAERLLILKLASSGDGTSLGSALGPVVDAAAALVAIDLRDGRALHQLLTNMPDVLRPIIFNPLAFQLTVPNALDPPPELIVPEALESLADMDVVGLRHDAGAFFGTFAAVLNLAEPIPDIVLPTSQTAIALAEKLRDMPSARAVVSMDVEIYDAVKATISRIDTLAPLGTR